MIDGVSSMDTGNNGQMLQLNVDAIAEVKVLTSGYQAEYGRSSGCRSRPSPRAAPIASAARSTTSSATPTGTPTAGPTSRTTAAEGRLEGEGLGLLDRRPGGQAGRQQQAVLLLQP